MQFFERGERGYPWLSFHPNNQWKLCSLVSLVILAISIGFFVWCTRVSDDMGGDSFAGLVFAIASTVFMVLAAVMFSLRRRTHKHQRAVGKLNGVLNWHVCFATISLVMVFLHAFGNFNPRTGTYALYGMIALVISGAIGRVLDRMVPRLIVQEVSKVLTVRGEDRIESITDKLQSTVVQNEQELRGLQQPQSRALSTASLGQPGASRKADVLQSAWDTAYISLKISPQEVNRTDQYQFGSSRKSALALPGALSLDGREPMGVIEEVQQAFTREKFFRYIIRYWRIFHIILAVVTVGLTIWHIEYALALIIPALQKFGFGYLLPWP